MRRGITLLIMLFGVLIALNNKIDFVQSKSSDIPEEAVRLRILANSNDAQDQALKSKVRDEVIDAITPLIEGIEDPDKVRYVIYENLDEIRGAIEKVMEENQVEINFTVDYGYTHFPEKVYNNKLYPAGTYESVYIVLGEGEGDNWWCVLFPPLCLVDIATKKEENLSENSEIEYSFFIYDQIKKLFGHN